MTRDNCIVLNDIKTSARAPNHCTGEAFNKRACSYTHVNAVSLHFSVLPNFASWRCDAHQCLLFPIFNFAPVVIAFHSFTFQLSALLQSSESLGGVSQLYKPKKETFLLKTNSVQMPLAFKYCCIIYSLHSSQYKPDSKLTFVAAQ